MSDFVKSICVSLEQLDFTKTNLLEYTAGREEFSKETTKYVVYDRIGGDFPTSLERHTDSILYGRHRLWYLNVLEKLS